MKKVLPVAVLAALAGVNGAQAVHVNTDGLGQVLVYPYYTTNASHDTLIQLVNTTDEYKAVKVRILESMNSQEVLDFNLYLSPWDHWSAQITAEGDGAAITSGDNSCTVPLAVSEGDTIPFRTTLFDGSGSNPEDSVSDLGRTKEGYIEVIEMGIVLDTNNSGVQTAIKHVDGEPGDCGLLNSRWLPGGVWDLTPQDNISAPTGGIYGYGVMIDVAGATDASYDAVALDNFFNDGIPRHSSPGDLAPSIGSVSPQEYTVLDGADLVTGATAGDNAGPDAVSALFMASSISNDYVLEPAIGAGTDWVVTFPTKRFYVNRGSETEALQPFTRLWDSDISAACESFQIRYWDREEGEPQEIPGQNDFSPLPPDPDVPVFSFCWEANVLTFNGTAEGFEDTADVLGALEGGRSGASFNFEEGFNNGWARISFEAFGDLESPDRELETVNHIFRGLPVTGFAVQRYINSSATSEGVNNRYAGVVSHKKDRNIESL